MDLFLRNTQHCMLKSSRYFLINHKNTGKAMAHEKEKNPSVRKKTKRRSPRLSGVSKRRKMANARERRRVHALNSHIENLRELIPQLPCEKRPSKTEVIWMAATYIEFLTELLQNSKNPADDKNVPKAAVVKTQEASACLDADGFAEMTGQDHFLKLYHIFGIIVCIQRN